jgi:superfamily II DNA or RNA helicase
VDRLIVESGWPADHVSQGHRIGAGDRVPFVVTTADATPLAVIDLARAHQPPAGQIARAVRWAERLDAPLAYAVSATQIAEFRLPSTSSTMPPTSPPAAPRSHPVAHLATPADAWAAYLGYHHLTVEAGMAVTQPFADIVGRDGRHHVPRYYQVVAVNTVVGAIAGGATRALLLMATGSGKTFVAAQIVAKLRSWHRAIDPNRLFRVLYLADRDILLDQPIRHVFGPAFGPEAIERVHRGVRQGAGIYFASYQMLAGSSHGPDVSTPPVASDALTQFPPNFFSLVIVDECHRGSARANSVWRGVLDYFAGAAQLGMTATPRDDTVNSYAYFGNPLVRYSLRDGIEDGYLAPWSVRRVRADIPESEWTNDSDPHHRGAPHPTGALARVAYHLSGVMREHPDERTVVFCSTVTAAGAMRDALAAANPDLVARWPDWVVRIVGVEEHRDRLVAQFTDPTTRTPVVATTSHLLDTGVDIEDLARVVLARPVRSTVEFKQLIGRGSRLYPPKGKTSFEIVDYVGATERFHDPDFDGFPADMAVQHLGAATSTGGMPAAGIPDPASPVAAPGMDRDDPVGRSSVDGRKRDPDDRSVRATRAGRVRGDPGPRAGAQGGHRLGTTPQGVAYPSGMSLASDLVSLSRSRGFLRLLVVRVAGQAGDGALQAGLAALFFFAPERASTPGGVAAAFAVLLGPFTLVGPWAGVLLDRWSRRGVLIWGNVVRGCLAAAIGLIMATAGITVAVYVLALAALSVSRFIGAGISSAQPRVVRPEALLTANSVAPTLGTVGSGIGALAGLVTAATASPAERAWVLAIAAALFAASMVAAVGFSRDALGPDGEPAPLLTALRALMAGLAQGWAYMVHRRTPVFAIGAMGLSRLAYGLVFIATILVSRHLLSSPNTDDGGLGTFALILGFAAAGFAMAAVITPLAHARVTPEAWVVVCAGMGVAGQIAVATSYHLAVLLPAALLLSTGVQGGKIAVDTIVQRDVADAFRGRAFALYDVAFNAAFLLAAAIAALALPADGYSRPLLIALAGFYALIGLTYWRAAIVRRRA